ncbi:MAG: NosD domain-containing protein [Candidatus Bathyarchaeia archaeon]
MRKPSPSGKALFIFTILVWAALSLGIQNQIVHAEPGTLYVPDDYAKIQWAINNATAGDTIFIRSGTYHEHLTVIKPVTIVGEKSETTIVDGDKEPLNIIEITASNVVIQGLTAQNSSTTGTYAGIKVSGQACQVTGNVVANTKMGIFVTSQNGLITKNIAKNNMHGISLYSSANVTVEANNVTQNTVGISLALSSNNTVQHNIATNSSTGGHGIILSSASHDNTITENDLVDNYHGMWLSDSTDNTILNNTVANNRLLGIELATSSNNHFYHNTFVNNPKHIVIDNSSINTWDYNYPSGGNYWHDYTTADQKSGPNQDQPGSDQIWDNPYTINDKNRDNYPSVTPYSNITHLLPDEDNLNAYAGPDQTAKVDTEVYFDGADSTGSITTYEWDFGDQTSGSGVTCSHTFSQAGTYVVVLTIRDSEGHSNTDQLTVTVSQDNNGNDQPAPTDTSTIWMSALAGLIIVVMLMAVLWKRTGKGKRKRRK